MRPTAALPNLLSVLRLLLIPILSLGAIAGQGRVVGIGLLVSGATDFLDGFLARRLGAASPAGARLDALADNLLLLAAAVWLLKLHPEIASDNAAFGLVTATVYVTSIIVSHARFRPTNRRLHSSKVAGGCLYAFAVVTLISGAYEPALLVLAATALLISSAENLFVALVGRVRHGEREHRDAAAALCAAVAKTETSGEGSNWRRGRDLNPG